MRNCIFLTALAMLLPAGFARAQNSDVLLQQSEMGRHGLTRAWFAQLPLAGMRSKTVAIVPDDDLILITTTTADVLALDAETGRLVWSTQVGDPSQPTFPPASNGNPVFRKAHWKAQLHPKRAAKPAQEAAPADAPAADAAAGAPPAADAAASNAADANAVAPGGTPDAAAPAAAPENSAPPAEAKLPAAEPTAPAANNVVVAVINGTTLFLLDRADGRPHTDAKSGKVWQTRLRNLPKNAPLVTDEYVYVPAADGHIESYLINDLTAGVTYMTSSGRNLQPPVIAGERVVWLSDRGSIHVTMPDNITPKYEILLGGPATAQLAVHTPYVFAADTDGDLFSIREADWSIFWKFPTGSPISEAPIAAGDSVYVMPDNAGIYCVGMADGHQQWVNDAPRQFLAVSPSKVYAVDRWNRMLILDSKQGGTLDTIPLASDIRPLTNSQTDRILLASDSGLLQCLHETLLTQPIYYPTPRIAAPPKPLPPTVSRPKPAADDADKPKPAPKPKKADADQPAPKAGKAAKAKAAGN